MSKKPNQPSGKKTKKVELNIPKHLVVIESMLAICIGLMAAVFVQSITAKTTAEKVANTTTETTTEEETKELPEFNISLKNTTLDIFKSGTKDDKYKGNTVEFTNGETTTYEDVEIKGRGNSTWGQPKPPFQLKFSEKIDFLGLGTAKKWVFLANYFDKTNLRNDIAFKLADMLGEKYANKGEFVKVTIDGEYLGVYYLTHKMEAKQGSVELQDKYGILMEIDNLHRATEDCYDSKYKTCVTIKDPVADEDEEPEIVEAAVEDFMRSYNRYEEAVRTKDYAHLSKIIDTKSLAEYYIISEFSNNPDAYDSSIYFYKDGADDILHIGPIWDYDFAFANHNWDKNAGEDIYSPYLVNPQTDKLYNGENIKEFYMLIEMPEFMQEVKNVFKEKLSGKKAEFMSYVEGRADLVKEEAEKDLAIWNSPSAIRDDNDIMSNDTEYLLDWLERKYDLMEYTYGK